MERVCAVLFIIYGMWNDILNHLTRQQAVKTFSALLEREDSAGFVEFADNCELLVFVYAVHNDLVESPFGNT